MPALLHDVGCRTHTLDGLVEREIERISRRCRDGGIYRSLERLEHYAGDEIGPGSMRQLRVSGENAGNRTVARQGHIHQEIVPRQPGNLEQLTMQRVVVDRALDSPRVPDELRAVQHLDGLLSGQPGGNQLAPARVAQHEMRFDETEREVEVGGDEPLVNVHRSAGLGGPEMAVGREIPGVVVHDSVRGRDLVSADFADFARGRGPVQTGGDQDRDVLPPGTSFLQPAQHGRDGQAIRSRPGDIAKGDSGSAFATRQLGQRQGSNRAVESRFQGTMAVGQGPRRTGFEHTVTEPVWQVDGNPGLAKSEVDFHHDHRTTGLRPQSPTWGSRVQRLRDAAVERVAHGRRMNQKRGRVQCRVSKSPTLGR